MTIEPGMKISKLQEAMDPNGDGSVTPQQASRMRDLLNQHAVAYGWKAVSDVEDVDWFRMRDESCKSI